MAEKIRLIKDKEELEIIELMDSLDACCPYCREKDKNNNLFELSITRDGMYLFFKCHKCGKISYAIEKK
jgi:hypothetical protein